MAGDRLRAPPTGWRGPRSTRSPGSWRRPGNGSVDEWFIAGTEPKDTLAAGHVRHRGVLGIAGLDERTSRLAEGRPRLVQPRASAAPGGRRPRPDPDRYFYNSAFQPYGASWGAIVGGYGCGKPSPSPTCFPSRRPIRAA